MRKKRLKEIEMWRIFREVFVFFMFFWILFVVCYTNTNPQTYRFQKSLEDLFVSSRLEASFTDVKIQFIITLFELKVLN